jgi:hypothetical protein
MWLLILQLTVLITGQWKYAAVGSLSKKRKFIVKGVERDDNL